MLNNNTPLNHLTTQQFTIFPLHYLTNNIPLLSQLLKKMGGGKINFG